MKILADKKDVKLLLEEKREYIGGVVANSISFCLAVISLAYSIYSKEAMAGVVDYCLLIICIITGWQGVKMLYRDVVDNYTHKDLYDDLEQLNIITHPFSLVVIRNEFESPSNRFLLRFDERWDCYLLPYYKSVENDEEHLTQRIASDLLVADVKLFKKYNEIYDKYSVSDEKIKTYDHTFYYARVELAELHKRKSFKIGNVKYKWFTLDEMKRDTYMTNHNNDVISVLEKLTF